MDDRDYPSDSDQSDEDFRLENETEEEEDISEEENNEGSSDDNEDTEEGEDFKKKAGRKRGKRPTSSKRKSHISQKKAKLTSKSKEELAGKSEQKSDDLHEINEEVEKKRSDELWASFLSDVSSESGKKGDKSSSNNAVSSVEATKTNNDKASESKGQKCDITGKKVESSSSSSEPEKTKIQVTETYEFAGEKVEITKEIPIDECKGQVEAKKLNQSNPRFSRGLPSTVKKSGGLSAVLNSINKKGKLSVLEKTKLDWDSFKKNERISEELQNFNRGKDGYLERQDFLERTDLRQFEIEKSLRQTKKGTR